MRYLPEPVPSPRPDPLAVAVGNASLLGLGYFLLRRRLLGTLNLLVSALLIVLLAQSAPERWTELTLAGWWMLVILHGWLLAGGRHGGVANRRQRVLALTVTALVVASGGYLRFDAAQISDDLAGARAQGDCAKATDALNRIWFGDRAANAPLMKETEPTAAACDRLANAGNTLARALDGQPDQLTDAYAELAAIRTELPGHERMADATVAAFLKRLPVPAVCTTASIDDWLTGHAASGPIPRQAAETVRKTAPAAYLACAGREATAAHWTESRDWYQRMVDRYPGDSRAATAKEGLTQATQHLELANVQQLVQNHRYCDNPAKYSAAPPYGPGTNRALVFGEDDYAAKFPPEWRTDDPAQATLVVCLSPDQNGTAVKTCPYENKTFPQLPAQVTFHKTAIPLKAYELRTGNQVADTTVEIDGASCPKVLEYTYDLRLGDYGPGSDVRVASTDDQVRAAFLPVFVR